MQNIDCGSFYYIWKSDCSSIICKETIPSPLIAFCLYSLDKNQLVIYAWLHIWILFMSIDLYVLSFCNISLECCSFTLNMGIIVSPPLFSLFQFVLWVLVTLPFYINWLELCWICRQIERVDSIESSILWQSIYFHLIRLYIIYYINI